MARADKYPVNTPRADGKTRKELKHGGGRTGGKTTALKGVEAPATKSAPVRRKDGAKKSDDAAKSAGRPKAGRAGGASRSPAPPVVVPRQEVRPEPKAKKDKQPVMLPKSLVDTVPAALDILKHLQEIDGQFIRLADELRKASDRGAIPLARAFVVLHALHGSFDARMKQMGATFNVYKTSIVPEVFEREDVPHIPLAEGFRVGTSSTAYASIKGGAKEDAIKWLKANNYEDIVQETVNSSTLSALARNLREEKNVDLPEDLFSVNDVLNTSVTRTK